MTPRDESDSHVEKCAICCEALLRSSIVIFDCGHVLHYQCAGFYLKSCVLPSQRLKVKPTCPICRLPLTRIIKPWGLGVASTPQTTVEEYESIFRSVSDKHQEEQALHIMVCSHQRSANTHSLYP